MSDQTSDARDPWAARFAFLWYNDFEIFHATQADLDRQVEQLASEGVNLAITCSCTHFRWSFLRWHDHLLDTLAKIVAACHKHGVRLVEHHSATLTFNPVEPEDEEFLLNVFKARKSRIESWPGLREDLRADPLLDGVPISSMQQIDGRTGRRARTGYHGYAICPNNTDYRRVYLKYLERVYATGVDGIMTDDVQFHERGMHSCACPTCRQLFREQTGHELPPAGKAWEAWHGRYDNPSYPAWLNFRFRSIEEYHRVIQAHYTKLGVKLLRPNYCSHILCRNNTAYALETLPELHWVAAECCFSDIPRYAWPNWANELSHRFAVGRHRQIPAGSYFYPDRADLILFTWALAQSCGVLYQPIREGGQLPPDAREMERRLWAFEDDHAELLRRPRKRATLGIFDSRRTRELYEHAESRSLLSQNGWMHACYRGNVPYDMFCQDELTARLAAYRTVLLSEAAILSDEELSAFKQFVEAGGMLLWAGYTGIKDALGGDRSEGFLSQFWGISEFHCAEAGDEPVRHSLGAGALVTLPAEIGMDMACHGFWSDRWETVEPGVVFDYDTPAQRRRFAEMTSLLKNLGHQADLGVTGAPNDLLVTAYRPAQADALVVHLLNATDTLAVPKGTRLTHADRVTFPPLEQTNPIQITIRKEPDLADKVFTRAVYHDPLREAPVDLDLRSDDETITVAVPAEIIDAYGLVELR